MRKSNRVLLDAVLALAVIASLSISALSQPQAIKADLVLLNGTVYTVNEKVNWDKQPQQAIAIAGKKIAYVGNDSGAKDFIGPGTRIVDLKGKMVLPGFIEAHMHPSGAAVLLAGVSLFNATTSDGYLKLVKSTLRKIQMPKSSAVLAGIILPLVQKGQPKNSLIPLCPIGQ